MSEFDNFGIIFKNTIVTIIIIILILCFIPTCTYIYGIFKYKNEDKLLNEFITTPIKIDMEHNTFENIYLLCNYIPYKRIKRCTEYKPGDEDLKNYNTFIVHAYNIQKKFDKIKKECEGHFYNDIKKNSDIAIQKNKDLRLEKEDRILQTYLGNEPKNNELMFKYLKGIFSVLNCLGDFGKDLAKLLVKIVGFFVPVAAAGFGNHVLVGFFILVFIIFMILYFVKLRNTNSVTTPTVNPNPNTVTKSSFSWFNGDSIWSEFSETYKYYDNMMNTFSFNFDEYTGGIFSTDDNTEGGAGAKNGNTKSLTINRGVQDEGKRYDNLSYIKLWNLGLTEGLPINIKENEYYNIYLPEEKFKFENYPSSIVKWKVETSLKNPKEKIWKINCSEIDKIKNTAIPAFINDVNDKEKCVININGLETANTDAIKDNDQFIYTTEKIK